MKTHFLKWLVTYFFGGCNLIQTPTTPTSPVTPTTPATPSPVQASGWCVPKPGVSDAQLQSNLDYVCSQGLDCGPLQPGGACFDPNTVASHAAYAMNLLYQTAGRNPWNCDFLQTATLTSNNPSKFLTSFRNFFKFIFKETEKHISNYLFCFNALTGIFYHTTKIFQMGKFRRLASGCALLRVDSTYEIPTQDRFA